MSINNAIYMIEGGRPLELILEHIADKQAVAHKIKEFADEFGTTRVATSKLNGALIGLHLDPSKPRPKDFTAPDTNGISRPRKNSEVGKRMAAIGGFKNPSETISRELRIPTQINYSKKGKFEGSRAIGTRFTPCGFMFLSDGGPFAMWTPDVEQEVAAAEAEDRGIVVAEPAKSFNMDIEGCRRLEPEEWQIIVLTQSLIRKREMGQLIEQRALRKS